MPPLLSVIVPTYNRSGILEQHIDVFDAFPNRIRLFIIDDGSSPEHRDRYIAMVDDLGHATYHRIDNTRLAGPPVARNVGARLARESEYFWFLDDDDRVHLDTIEDVVAWASSSPTKTLLLPMEKVSDHHLVSHNTPPEGDLYPYIRQGEHFVNTSCIVVPSGSFFDVGGWDSTLVTGQDTDLLLRLSLVNYFSTLETVPVEVSVDTSNRITTKARLQIFGKLQFLAKHWRHLTVGRRLYYIFTVLSARPYWRDVIGYIRSGIPR